MNFITRKPQLADCDLANELHHATKGMDRDALLLNLAMALNDRKRLQSVVAGQRNALQLMQTTPATKSDKRLRKAIAARAGVVSLDVLDEIRSKPRSA